MRLEKVEIFGFKSFCDRQEVSFLGGVTGIVGPNGCGKSNISDAISWVLGEQSVKSLRGTSMEDVIFAGSQSRQPLAMAEVNLKVSGLNGDSPDGNPECVITRRLYRNGDSEYMMNGRICRLRDIHELFMDTGLGSKAYSIIEQGKIGLILSSKPTDRRALIEEAAGITKYKARRKQTSVKLEAAQQNLLRVNDIVHEVEKQLDGLKRQASRARRYRALRDEMQGLEQVLFGRRFVELTGRLSALDERLAAQSEREQAAAIALGAEEAQMEARRGALDEEVSVLQAARSGLHELTLAVDRYQGKGGFGQAQIADSERRAAEARSEAEELRSRLSPLAETVETRRAEQAAMEAERRAADEEAAAQTQAQELALQRQAAAEAELEAAREDQIGLLGRIAALQNARESTAANAERAQAEAAKLAGEWDEMESDRSRVAALREAARRRREEGDASLRALAAERQRAIEEAAEAKDRLVSSERECEALQSERDALAGRLASLQEMVATHAAFDEGVRALLERPDGVEVLGVAADFVDTEPVYERAAEAFLGSRLQAVLVRDGAMAVRAVRHLEGSEGGRAGLLALSASPEPSGPPLAQVAMQEPKVRALLADVVRVSGPQAERLGSWLPDALIVETLEDALEIAARRGPLPFATLAGEAVRGALVEGGRAASGILAPRREVREGLARQQQLEAALAAARAAAAGHRERLSLHEADARGVEERIHAGEKDLVALARDLAAAEEEWARLHRKAAVLESEKGQATQDRQAAAARLVEIGNALAAAEVERSRGSDRLAALAIAVATARASAEAAQSRVADVKTRLAALTERAAAAEAECRRLGNDRQELLFRIAAAEDRAQAMDRRRTELASELAESERLLSEALIDRDRTVGEVARAEDRVRDLRNELEAREAALKERRRERDTLKDALTELEIERARIGSDLDHLARECQQAVGRSAAEAAALLTEDDRGQEVTTLEDRVTEIRERLERMGPVNVLAVEQAQELTDRLAFLQSQRQDLTESIAELEQAIRKIDRTSRERFREAFTAIDAHFGEIFRQLFGGGSAGLRLIDEEDELESGIDVMAQPPGKRLQNVMLLSGGEKALTAIALLFAIFQYKPSPFCILDEVDAPLDDANIGRFVRMLDGLKERTQFVLITHSRKTMEIADQLYGVTMEEPGVSKLVSVRLS
jgi:chromosome segregation protein